MKKKILLLMGVFSLGLLQAQVGINTTNPQGIFHVDSKTNTNGSTDITDDVIVDKNGNIGVGTIDPNAKLHIKTLGTNDNPIPGFILQDGNQGITKVLTTDNQGNATWKLAKPQKAILGTFGNGVAFSIGVNFSGNVDGWIITPRPNNTFSDTGARITLPPGRWWIKVALAIENIETTTYPAYPGEQLWVRTTISDSEKINNTGSQFGQHSADIEPGFSLASGLIWKSGKSTLTGSFIIRNTNSSDKDYYFIAGSIENYYDKSGPEYLTMYKAGLPNDPENIIVAYRIKE